MERAMGSATGSRTWKGIAAAVVAAALAGMPVPARAQEPTRLDPIVVTATRIEQKVSEQASSVSVVGREEIDLKSPDLAGDVLRGIPGVDAQRSGGPGNRENIKLRGGLAAHTLVLIDGFPVNSPSLGSFDIGSLPLDDFERVEVVRGAQSALYGSGALGGVVNFIPRKGMEGRRYGAGIMGGSHNTVKGNASAQGGGEHGNLHIGATGWRSDGFLPNDQGELVSFMATGDAAVGGRSRLHAIVFSTDQEKGIPIDFGNPSDANHLIKRRSFLSGARWETAISKALTVSASGMAYQEYFNEKDPADPGQVGAFVFEDVTRTRKVDFRIEGRFVPGPSSTTILGAEYEKDRAVDDFRSNFGDTAFAASTYNRSVFAQQEFRPTKRTGISLGVRLDKNSEAGTQFNPKAAAYREIGGRGARVRAAVGRGFRVPTISEKRDVFVGNPALLPEKAISYEAGTDIPFAEKRGMARATYFYQAFRDLILFDDSVPGPLGIGELRNKGSAFSRGIEAEVSLLVVPQAEAAVSYTWSDTWDGSRGKRIIGIPSQKAMATLMLSPAAAFRARVDWIVESDQEDARLNGALTKRPGYGRVDAYAQYRWVVPGAEVREIALTGKVQNLLDRKYQERLEFPAPGFNFMLGAEVKI